MIEQALGLHGVAPSEHCFANLFLFRQRHAYRLCSDPLPYLRGVTYDGAIHALPLVPIDVQVLAAFADAKVDCLYPLGSKAENWPLPAGWARSYVEADSDYWFDGRAMAQMRFAKARRAEGIAFEKQHEPVFKPWDDSCADMARGVLAGWLTDVGRPASDTDHAECSEAIALTGALRLRGGIVLARGDTPAAFMLASRREDGVDVVHFAKGRRAMTGAYPWMFARFAAANASRLLNFEQDLGNAGLAQSKRAYRPVERRCKWRLIPPTCL